MDPTFYLDLQKTEAECSRLNKKVRALEKQLEAAKAEFSAASKKREELKQARFEYESELKIKTDSISIDGEWISRQFAWSEKVDELMKTVFGFEKFRPKQLAAINATLAKKDVLLVMPTGGGKSLTYQLPALYDSGFTLVVSPLISLIEDQLFALRKLGVHAATINSGTPKAEVVKVYAEMAKNSNLKLVYVTPEWLAKSKRFLSNLKSAYEAKRISRVAIDEVHCCSTWGHDFRPDYGFLGLLRETLETVPFLGVTATATMKVLSDIQSMLCLKDCLTITAPFNRPNLFYQVVQKPPIKTATAEYIIKLLNEDYIDQTGIIYTTTINESINLAVDLKNAGLKVAPYHAQLEPDKKTEIHQKWIKKKIQAVIATIAFGMGIDKPDVRFVIHYSLPKSMESLYQESGRAGRDGKPADCIVLFSLNDYFKVHTMVSSVVEEKKSLVVLEYCLDQIRCRRALIADHFEETWEQSFCNKMCDHCNTEKVYFAYYDLTRSCSALHSVIENASKQDEKLTLIKLLDGWLQTGPKKLRVPELKAPSISKKQAEMVVAHLLMKKYLAIDKGYNMYSTICYIVKGKPVGGEKIEFLTSDIFVGFCKRPYTSGKEREVISEKKVKVEIIPKF